MGRYKVMLSVEAAKDIERHRRSGDKAVNKRIERILNELSVHPQTGAGNPERLRYALSGYWSRRLSSEHRMIYRIDDDIVTVAVVSAFGHYE